MGAVLSRPSTAAGSCSVTAAARVALGGVATAGASVLDDQWNGLAG